jgi:uncharacterized repeat protein (TIGR01451 family)
MKNMTSGHGRDAGRTGRLRARLAEAAALSRRQRRRFAAVLAGLALAAVGLSGHTAAMASPAIAAGPGLAISQSADPTTISAAGQVITYTFAVSNIGGEPLTDVSIDDEFDPATEPSGQLSDFDCPEAGGYPIADLPAGTSQTCTATYTVRPDDLANLTGLDNTATAHAPDPAEPLLDISSNTSSAVVDILASAIHLEKTAHPSTFSAAGQVITYRFAVANAGNAPVTDVSIDDAVFTGTGTRPDPDCPVAPLGPQETETCTASYTTTQADLDAGLIINVAIAQATGPAGNPISSDPWTVVMTASPEPPGTPAPAPAITVLKSASPSKFSAAGQVITYRFYVVNTGNVALTGVHVTDTRLPGLSAVSCPRPALAPGKSEVCTATYTTTQADVDAGRIINTATAAGTPTGSATLTVSPPSAVKDTITVSPRPLVPVTG